MVSVTSDGEKRWEKLLLEDRNFIDEFLPKGNVVQDTYLLAFTTSKLGKHNKNMTSDKQIQPKIIKAYNTNGEEIWQCTEEKPGTYPDRYSIDKDNRFYFYFDEKDISIPSWETIHSYYTCMSSTGDVIWENQLDNEMATCPSFDANNNSYVGFISKDHQEGMYSFYLMESSDGY